MPKLKSFCDYSSDNIFRSSIVAYDTNKNEDIFLSFTETLKNGPRIIRTGIAPPYMLCVTSQIPGETTTNPTGQRSGSWLILENLRERDIKEAKDELTNAEKLDYIKEDIEIISAYIREAEEVESHESFFLKKYPNYRIIGMQGCGDLTMNLWNVGYVNSELTDNNPTLIHLFEEPLGKRTYSCLVKMKATESRSSRLSIEDLKFNQFELNPEYRIYSLTRGRPIGTEVEFAVYGKQIIRDGEIVNIQRITNEFSDLRHIFKFPNLNPKDKFKFEEDKAEYRPRFYFGTMQNENLWFGEAQLLDHPNEQRAAICGPVFLSRLYRGMGASEEQIRGAAEREGYHEVKKPREDLSPGQFRFVPEDNTLVEIYLLQNKYAWSIIGLSEDNSEIISMACEGKPGMTGYNLREVAEEAIKRGRIYNGLLMDEGYDVFQIADISMANNYCENVGGTDLNIIVPKSEDMANNPMNRTRLRAVFLFAKILEYAESMK